MPIQSSLHRLRSIAAAAADLSIYNLQTPTPALYNFLPLQTLAVDKWNTDSVEEFLSIYLVKDGDETSEETEEVLAQP